jgi:hypothetical protein
MPTFAPTPDLIARIDPDVLASISRWVFRGIKPGGFLTAVLQNDLYTAVSRADGRNAAALKDIAVLLFTYCPTGCYGSREKVEKWLSQRMWETEPAALELYYGWLKEHDR